MRAQSRSDRELWSLAAEGDANAFGDLFDRHARSVYNHLFRRTADWSEAEDLTSAVFLAAWRRRAELVLDRDSVLPWLLGIANGTVSNAYRARRRAAHLFERLVSASPAASDAHAEDHADEVARHVDDQRRMAEVRKALAKLPRHEREVIELCVWSGLDQQAAAVALGVPLGTVKSRLHRARRRLGADLAPDSPASAPVREPAMSTMEVPS